MAGLFNLVGKRQLSKQLGVKKTLGVGSDYGTTFYYDLVPPDETVTLEGRGFEYSELTSWQSNLRSPATTVTVHDNVGNAYTGYVVGLSWSQIPGLNLYEASLTMRLQ